MAKMKKKTRNIISIILVALLTIGAGFGIHAIVSVKTKTISPSIFSTGSLNVNGEYVASKKSLYNENMFECQGLKIQRDFESTVTYDVHYYDVAGVHLGEENVTGEYYELPTQYENARYCRLEIKPQGGKDISFFERYNIAKQLTITVDKDQDYTKHNKLQSVNAYGYRFNDGKYEKPQKDEIACSPILICDSQGNYYNRIVILTNYDLNVGKIDTIYFVNNNVETTANTGAFVVDKKDLSPDNGKKTIYDGYYCYEITINPAEDFKNVGTGGIGQGCDVFAIFNFVRTQEQPQVYLYNYTTKTAQS